MFITKKTLKELKLQIEYCDKCKHPTLQHKDCPGEWLCLTCGTVWVLKFYKTERGS